jgi:hypothetical protein
MTDQKPAATEVMVPLGTLRAAALALRSYQHGNSATALADACANELERFTGPGLMPPVPTDDTVPQDPEEILMVLIGELGGLAMGDVHSARRLQASLAAAMSLLVMWKRRQAR